MLSKLTKSKCINYREVFVSWRGSELRARLKVSYGLYQKSAMKFIKSKPKRRGGGHLLYQSSKEEIINNPRASSLYTKK